MLEDRRRPRLESLETNATHRRTHRFHTDPGLSPRPRRTNVRLSWARIHSVTRARREPPPTGPRRAGDPPLRRRLELLRRTHEPASLQPEIQHVLGLGGQRGHGTRVERVVYAAE